MLARVASIVKNAVRDEPAYSESTFRVHAIAAVEVTADDEFVTNDAMEAVTTKVEANPSFLRYAALKRRQKCARVRVGGRERRRDAIWGF